MIPAQGAGHLCNFFMPPDQVIFCVFSLFQPELYNHKQKLLTENIVNILPSLLCFDFSIVGRQ